MATGNAEARRWYSRDYLEAAGRAWGAELIDSPSGAGARNFLAEMEEEARKLLSKCWLKVERLALALAARRTLTWQEIQHLLRGDQQPGE